MKGAEGPVRAAGVLGADPGLRRYTSLTSTFILCQADR